MPLISHEGVDYGSFTYQVQDSATAPDLGDMNVPTGRTVKSYLNENHYLKYSYTAETQTINNGGTLNLSSYNTTDMLYIHFSRWGHQGWVFGFKSGLGGSNGMRILFGNQYFITLSNPSDNLNTLKVETDSAFPSIVCNIYKLA